MLQQLKMLYPEAYAQVPTSTIGPLWTEYELEQLTGTQEAGTPIDLIPFGGYPSPICAHECREIDVGSKVEAPADLYPIIHYHSPGWAQERREDSEDGAPTKCNPPLPIRRDPWPNLGRRPPTPCPRGG